MIKASELRVGNKVRYKGDTDIWTVTAMTQDEIACDADNELIPVDAYDPIPLTPELLERCGFDDLRKEMINVEFVDKHHAINECDNGWTFYPFCTNDKDLEINITSLHQLMNLYFALTGSELAIKND